MFAPLYACRGYAFNVEDASATGRTCDWSSVGAVPDMPACSFATCDGHKEDDLLPFTNLFEGQGEKLLSNAELYAIMSPYNGNLPYAYDSMSTWKGCTGESLLVEAGLSPASASDQKRWRWPGGFM